MAISVEEQSFADRTISAHAGRPERYSASWSASRNIIAVLAGRKEAGDVAQ